LKTNYLFALIALLFITFTTNAQNEKPRNESTYALHFNKKKQLGIALGIGSSRLKISKSNWQQGSINYNDSLKDINANSILKVDFGLIYQLNINNTIALRPTLLAIFEGGKNRYEKYSSTESINLSTISYSLSIPLILKRELGKSQPYISIGPSFLYMLAQHEDAQNLIPLKAADVLGEFGLGIDFLSKRLKAVVSPEIQYSHGFFNLKSDAYNLCTDTIEELKRQSFTLSFVFRQM